MEQEVGNNGALGFREGRGELVPPFPVEVKLKFGDFAANGSPSHVDGVLRLSRVLVSEVAINFLQSGPHAGPVVGRDVVEQVDDESGANRIARLDEDAEAAVVQVVLEG